MQRVGAETKDKITRINEALLVRGLGPSNYKTIKAKNLPYPENFIPEN